MAKNIRHTDAKRKTVFLTLFCCCCLEQFFHFSLIKKRRSFVSAAAFFPIGKFSEVRAKLKKRPSFIFFCQVLSWFGSSHRLEEKSLGRDLSCNPQLKIIFVLQSRPSPIQKTLFLKTITMPLSFTIGIPLAKSFNICTN